jgi:hypothetical protein
MLMARSACASCEESPRAAIASRWRRSAVYMVVLAAGDRAAVIEQTGGEDRIASERPDRGLGVADPRARVGGSASLHAVEPHEPHGELGVQTIVAGGDGLADGRRRGSPAAASSSPRASSTIPRRWSASASTVGPARSRAASTSAVTRGSADLRGRRGPASRGRESSWRSDSATSHLRDPVARGFAAQALRVVADGQRRQLVHGGDRRQDGRVVGADQQRRETAELGATAEQAGLAQPRGRVRRIVVPRLTGLFAARPTTLRRTRRPAGPVAPTPRPRW